MSNTLYHHAAAMAKEALNDELAHRSTATQLEVVSWLLALRLNQRFYYLCPEVIQAEIWPIMRRNDDILDTVLKGFTGFYLRMQDADGTDRFRQYREALVQSLIQITPRFPKARVETTDQTFREKLPTNQELDTLLENEGWVVFLLTLERVANELIADYPHLLTERKA